MHETVVVLRREDMVCVRGKCYLLVPQEALPSIKRTFSQSEYITATFNPVVERRRKEQNGLYQTLIKEMCIESGNDPETMKDMVKSRAVYMGYPCEKDEFGLDVFVGDMPVPKSSADVSIEEFEALIESCYRVADEIGIYLRRR